MDYEQPMSTYTEPMSRQRLLQHRGLTRMLRQPRLSQGRELNTAHDLIFQGGISTTKPEDLRDVLTTPTPTPSATSRLDNADESLLFSDLLPIVSSMRQDTRMAAFLSSTNTMSSTSLSPCEMDFSQVETTTMYPASMFSDVSTAAREEMTTMNEEVTSTSLETTIRAAESNFQSTPSAISQTQELLLPTTMETIASSFSLLSTSLHTSQADIAPTLIRSSPPASVNLPSATTSAIPISPEGADVVHHDPPVHKYFIMAGIFLTFLLLFIGIYAATNFKRFLAWLRQKNAPRPVQWDYGVWEKLKDEETAKVPADNVQDLRSRFSDATSASAYSSVTSARSSTMSEYYVDPRYSGPTVLPPILPPTLRDAQVAQSFPSATPHTLTSRPLHLTTLAPGASPLLSPDEFFSLPSTNSVQAEFGKHERTGSAPVFGYVPVGEGQLRERREAGMSRASRLMSRSLATDGISGVGATTSGRRSNSVSVLMDPTHLMPELPRWL
ncbi:hypothetical protein CPB85DRAFT_1459726 [Mucidula mucida]|nr:hypothetical protein CPB85DRAFT_1459726 [Mucidula mucida]